MWSPALRPPDVPHSRELSLEEWIGLPEDVLGELVDGRLVEEEAPDPLHGLAVAWMIRLPGNWLAGKGGFVFDSDVKVVISASGGRKPDVSVYLPGRQPPPRRGALRDPPDIAIEVGGSLEPRPRPVVDERTVGNYGGLGFAATAFLQAASLV